MHGHTNIKYTNCCLFSASWGWASSSWNMYTLLIHYKQNTNTASRWFYCTDILQCTVNRTLSLTMLYQSTHLWANIHIHFHGNRWPTFIPTFRCLPTHSLLNGWHICQPFIFIICRACKVKTPPHVLHWPTFFKPVHKFHVIMLHDQHWPHFVHSWLVPWFIIACYSWPRCGTPRVVMSSMSCWGPLETWTENASGHPPPTFPSPYKQQHKNTGWLIIKYTVPRHKIKWFYSLSDEVN
jgi:hypothetical protein